MKHMKQIKDQIKDLNKYFKHRVLDGEYGFIRASEHIAEIVIYDKYTFNFWIANGSNAFKQYTIDSNEPVISVVFDSDIEKEIAYDKIMIEVNKYKKSYLKDEKIKAIEKLQKELKELE